MSTNGRRLEDVVSYIAGLITFCLIIIGVIIFVFLYNSNLVSAGIAFLLALVIVAPGLIIIWTIKLFFGCIGEMTECTAVQLDVLKKLAQTTSEIKKLLVEVPASAAAPVPTPAPTNSNETNKQSESNEVDKDIDTQTEVEKAPPNKEHCSLYYDSRSLGTIECMLCDTVQDTTNDRCIYCRCKFIYKDER